MNLQLIADKAALFFLNQFGDVGVEVEQTKTLIRRKIDGDNPTKEEWVGNANNFAHTFANDFAYDLANGNAHTYAYAEETADYIIKLLGDDLILMPDIDKQVLFKVQEEGNTLDMSAWHYGDICGTTHCRAGWEVVIHPQGGELEKYFGKWMAASVIHKSSTGVFADYYASKDEAMADLEAA